MTTKHTDENCRVTFCDECLARIKSLKGQADRMHQKGTTKTSEDEYQKLQQIYLDWHDGKRPMSGFIRELQKDINKNYRPITTNSSIDLKDLIAQNISHAIQGVQEYKQKDIEDYYRNRGEWMYLMTERIMEAVESQTRSVTAIKEAIDHVAIDGVGLHDEQIEQLLAALQLDEGGVK